MTSDDVAKAVAKRLKFYLDTERREDAFDLSGPYRPERNQPALRPGSSLAYEGLHDRSLKHYYRQKDVKQQLQKMKTVDGLHGREKQVKKRIESTMQKYDYKITPKKISPYAKPNWVKLKSATQPSEAYFKPKKTSTSRRKKRSDMVVGKEAKVGRRAPDEKVSLLEQQRLVNMATKLIVATETIALPQNRRRSKGNQTDSSERLPFVRDDVNGRPESSASDPGPRATPHPPEKKHHSQRHRSARPRRWNDSSSGETSLDSTMDSVRSQMQELNLKLNSSGSSFVVSEKDDRSPTANHTDQADQETSSQTKLRPKSAGDELSPNHADSDYDDFYDHASSQVSPLTSPRSAWTEKSPRQTVDSCTQTVENKGTQTAEELETKDAAIEAWPERKQTQSRSSSFDKSVLPSTNAGTQVEETTETKPRQIERKVLAYEVFVVTGDKLGAGTNSDVKINVFGEFGDSGDRPLIRSKSNRNPFERKNVDLFIIDSIFLGNLTSIRIGHNGTALGTGWFLDRVVIREGQSSARSYEFKCGRWLSARDDDGQIVRDLPLSATLSGKDVPKTSNANRTYFKYRQDSASSNDSIKMPFRPLSAKRDSDLNSELTHEPKSSTSSTMATEQDAEKPKRQYFTRGAEKSSSDDESEKEDDKNENEADTVESHMVENNNEAKEIDEIQLAKKTVEAVIKAAQESSAEEFRNRAKEKAAKEMAAKDVEGNESDTADVQMKEAGIEHSEHEVIETKPKSRTKKRSKYKKERRNSDSENKKQNEDRNHEDPEVSVVVKSPTNLDTDTNHDATRDMDADDNEETLGKDENLPATSNEDQNTSEIVKEDEIQATEEADIAAKAAEEDSASNHSSDSESSSSSSDSELFSLSSDSSSSDESEDEAKKDAGSDDEEEVERVQMDTSKKENATNDERKKSAQEDYMAGFLAGVRASQENVRKETPEQMDSVLTKGASIHQACESGDFDRIKELVNEVPELKKKPDERGWSPLHIVSAFGHLDILKWLTVNGINLTEETPTGFSAIHLAAMNGHVKCIMVLAAMGCPLGCRTVDESTPLHSAAMSGHVECVRWLLANRANHAVRDSNDRKPLDLAREYQHDDCVELLELMENEMKRKDSIITKLRHPQLKDLERGESSEGADNGFTGVDSGEDAWISDAEEDVVGRGDRPTSGRAKSGSFGAAKERRKSRQEQRADDEKEEKRKIYEKQQEKMIKKKSSFLDSIRQEIDDGGDDNF